MVARLARSAREHARRFGPDAATVGGGGTIVLGLWLIYEPIALIVGGALVAAGGIAADHKKATRKVEAAA